jgi:hypothetical protein
VAYILLYTEDLGVVENIGMIMSTCTDTCEKRSQKYGRFRLHCTSQMEALTLKPSGILY